MKKILLLFFLPLGVLAQVSAPKYSNEFLVIGVGARGLAMSGTQTALAEDVTAGYWNPAGLLRSQSKYEVSLMHAEYFAGIAKFDYLAFATPIDSLSHIGVSVIRFGVDDIADTRFLYDAAGTIDYSRITFFSSADYAFLLSYARKIKLLNIRDLRLGANVKVIHRYVGNFATAWGFGFDVGMQLLRKRWQFGANLRDVTSTFNAWSHNTSLVAQVYAQTGNVIPENSIELTLPRLTLGVGRSFTFFRNFGLTAGLDVDVTFDGRRNTLFRELLKNSGTIFLDAKAGLETDYKKIVFLRLGAGNVQKSVKSFNKNEYKTTFQPNFGVGFKISQFTIDYALTDIGDQSEALYSNVFSIKAGF
jgi:hypothetical protein